MSTRRIQFEGWIPYPVPHVFAFFSNPENLSRIMPVAMQTRIDELYLVPPPQSPDSLHAPKTAGVGTVIATSSRIFRFLPLRARWIARISEFEWNHHFADTQQEGPFKNWHHRHEFLSETRNRVSGTLIRDVIEYEVGFGPLGALANSLLVARRMHRTFAQRQKILPELLS